MDLTESIAPKSEQLDAVDLLGGPRTFTITNVTEGKPDQPFHFHLEGFPRTWRPSKGMRRVIVQAWGPKPDKYIGQRVTLFCDPTVKFGNDVIGGTRISHMSGIQGELKVPMIIKRGQSGIFTVQPLKEAPSPAPARDWAAAIAECRGNEGRLRALHAEAEAAGLSRDLLARIRSAVITPEAVA